MRKIKRPSNEEQAERIIDHTQENFLGMWADLPASELPKDGLAYLNNINSFGEYLATRTGSYLYSDTSLPYLRRYYTASQTGNTITITSGGDFTSADVGDYFVFPGDDEIHNQITAVASATSITVRDSRTVGSTSRCWIREPVYALKYHKSVKKWVLHIGDRLFMASTAVPSWQEIDRQGTQQIAASQSLDVYELEDDILIRNANGIFRAIIDTTEPYYYKMNAASPDDNMDDAAENLERHFGYRYLYNYSRLINDDHDWDVDRTTDGTELQQESGTNLFRGADNADYAEAYTPTLVGCGGVIYGATGVDTDINNWRAITAGGFTITCAVEGGNLNTIEMVFDFSTATSLDDVAAIVETGLRYHFPNAVVEHLEAGGGDYFRIHSGIRRGRIQLLTAPTTATNISGSAVTATNLRCGAGYAATTQSNDNTPAAAADDYVVNGQTMTNALECTNDAQAMSPTHFSVWRTLEIGERGLAKGNNPELYGWLFDIPIMSAFRASRAAGGMITITSTVGFYQRDLGSQFVFEVAGAAAIIYLTTGAGIRTSNNQSDYCMSGAGAIAEQSAAIGATHVLTINQTGHTVERVSGTRAFLATDVGEMMACSDGTWVHIAEYIDGDHVRVIEAGDKANVAAALDPDDRNVHDNIEDEIIKARMDTSFTEISGVLASRKREPLPDGDRMAVVPGFIITGQSGEKTVYYSETSRRYRSGIYRPNTQFDDGFEDPIQFMYVMPDRCIVWTTTKTYYTKTNIPIGETLANVDAWSIIPNFSIVDEKGSLAPLSVAKVGVSRIMLLTNEPAIRQFDGSQYGPNLSGRQVETIVSNATVRSLGHYDEIDGYKLWTEAKSGSTIYYLQNGRCIRSAVKEDQGVGWSEYSGDSWIRPEPNAKPVRVILASDLIKNVALDELSGKLWEISTYSGPSGSGLTQYWEDKAKDGYAGVEIPWEFTLREHRGTKEYERIQNIQGNLYVRPQNEANRNTSGHDAGGFRNAQEITEKIYADGELTESTRSRDIPIQGNVATDRKVEAHRLQTGYEGTASELRVVRTNQKYLQRDTRGIPSETIMTEQDWQIDYTNPMLWFSRSVRLIQNRATGEMAAGSIFSSTTGPDSKDRSAMVFSGANGLTTSLVNSLTGDFTIQFSVSGITGTTEVFTSGTFNVQIRIVGGIYYVRVNDGADQHDQALGWSGSGWANVQIVRSGDSLIVRENGTTLNTFALAAINTIGTSVQVMNAQDGWLFDLRVYASAVSENAYRYYYEDLTENSGDSLCPGW